MQNNRSNGADAIQPQDRNVLVRIVWGDDKSRWDTFVRSHPTGTFFHLFDWQAIFVGIFGLKPFYLIAERAGTLVGVLPLVHQKSILFGNAFVSTPFCVHGGPLSLDQRAAEALDQAAITLTSKYRAKSLEYRSHQATRPGWRSKKGLYATFSRELASDDEKNLALIPRKQRAVVRKALQGDLFGSVGKDVPSFFRVYSESMRNLGTPMFPKRYFQYLLNTFPDACDIVIIRQAYEPVSAVLNFYFKDTVLPYYGGGTTAARQNGANDLLYWEVMRNAASRGYKRFDFGRSKAGTGAFAFKKNWGFEPAWLEYEYWLPQGGAVPEKNPTNPVYASLSKAWKRLPLPIANFIGPFLIRGLG
jgi:FemAB-related protein (PEP-CTERM system-associated)